MKFMACMVACVASAVWLVSCKTGAYKEVCTTNADCRPPSVCSQGLCRSPCARSSDCRQGLECLGGACVPASSHEPASRESVRENPEEKEQEREGQDASDSRHEKDAGDLGHEAMERVDTGYLDQDAEADLGEPEQAGDTGDWEEADGDLDADFGESVVRAGTCVQGDETCPQGTECTLLANSDDFPPECRKDYWDEAVTPKCYACAPLCSNSGDCSGGRHCTAVGGGRKVCMRVTCGGWKYDSVVVRAAPVGVKEDSGYWTLAWTSKEYDGPDLVLGARSECRLQGQGFYAMEKRIEIVFKGRMPSADPTGFEIGSDVKLLMSFADVGLCEDIWEAKSGSFTAFVPAGSDRVVVNADHLVFERVETSAHCIDEDTKAVLSLVGLFGKGSDAGLNASCTDVLGCMQGYVCAGAGPGGQRCRPQCSTDWPDSSGCFDGEKCSALQSGLEHIGACVPK